MRVLVTGGSGLLGRRTIAALAARGHDVVALQRHRDDALECRAGARRRARRRRGRGRRGRVRRASFTAPRRSASSARARSSERSTSAAPRRSLRPAGPPACRDSSSSLRRRSATSRRRRWVPVHRRRSRSEAIAPGTRSRRPRPSSSRWRRTMAALAVTAIRPHAIWGPGDTQLVGRIVERARAGRLFVVGGGRALIDTTYVDNAADALVVAAEQLTPDGPLAGRAFVVSNGEPLPLREPPGADLRGRRRAASGARPPARPRARHGCGGRAPVGPGPARRRAAGNALPRRPARPRALVRPAPVPRGDGLAAGGHDRRGHAPAGGVLPGRAGAVAFRPARIGGGWSGGVPRLEASTAPRS